MEEGGKTLSISGKKFGGKEMAGKKNYIRRLLGEVQAKKRKVTGFFAAPTNENREFY
jgi:hypothetical protein